MVQPEISEVFKANEVLRNVAVETPITGPTQLSDSCEVYLKAESMQLTGSFKLRGAYYKISQLNDEEKKRGVIACSAGNHAQGVALGATHNGIKALICLPTTAPISKVEATKNYGGEICMVGGVYDDAYEKALELQKEGGYTFIHPFDDPLVIAGQGTIGLEILRQLPEVEAVVVPVGGGGLISGVAFAIKTLRPDVKVYGVQAEGAPSMKKSLDEGHRVHLKSVSTIADGIAVKEPGETTFEMCRKYVDEVVTVSDDEIAAAILTLMEKQKMVSEGAGA
ncbi:MAG: pyridoxal-phosphate dependent enzyme, partial [Muribaculaceae bacterium]|nr:pyridoxal-phosphate dependent enzyme [Muribaculaceae bacterium]